MRYTGLRYLVLQYLQTPRNSMAVLAIRLVVALAFCSLGKTVPHTTSTDVVVEQEQEVTNDERRPSGAPPKVISDSQPFLGMFFVFTVPP